MRVLPRRSMAARSVGFVDCAGRPTLTRSRMGHSGLAVSEVECTDVCSKQALCHCGQRKLTGNWNALQCSLAMGGRLLTPSLSSKALPVWLGTCSTWGSDGFLVKSGSL